MVSSKVNELKKFLDVYGTAWNLLKPEWNDKSVKTLATINPDIIVSLVVDGNLFIIPALPPNPTLESVEEFLTLLLDGVLALRKQLSFELPAWVSDYRFPAEGKLIESKTTLVKDLNSLDEKLETLGRLKRILLLQGEPLVEAVMELFDKVMPLKPQRKEAFLEDLSFTDTQGTTVAYAEVKGVSTGVKREHVNQADSHRERNGQSSDFPPLLIINTFIKSSSSLEAKNRPVDAEQVEHAARNSVLILRTIDLLNLASLLMAAKLTDDEVVAHLTHSGGGWLEVDDVVSLHKTMSNIETV